MTWSYSRLKCFIDCPYRWYLKYIIGASDCPQQFYSSFGKIVHHTLKDYFLGKQDLGDLKKQFIINYQNEIVGEKPSAKIVSNFITNTYNSLNEFKGFPLKTISVEDKFDFVIDKFKFTGFIDYIGEINGDLYIVDHKSRNLKPRSNKPNKTKNDILLNDMYKQLYIYSEAVKQKFGKYPKELWFNCYKTNTLIKETFEQTKCEEAKRWAIDCIQDIKNMDFFNPNIEYFSCKFICDVNEECCYWKEG